MKSSEASKQIRVKIVSSDFVEEYPEVKSVSAKNEQGTFDILSSHARFISILKEFVDVVLVDGSKKHFDFDQGVIKVSDNEVTIFIEKY